MIPSKKLAIQTALLGDWQSAIAINESLLLEDPRDIETLNRLGYAYTVVGKLKEAKQTYQKVLTIDKLNPIAQRNLKRLSKSSSSSTKNDYQSTNIVHANNMFLEEPGRTKVIELTNIAPAQVVTRLRTGQLLQLSIKRLKIFVQNEGKTYIGMLPEDLGKRLIRFMGGGNAYEAYVKSADQRRVIIFIKEVKRTPRFKDQPSFPATFEVSHLTIEKSGGRNEKERNKEDYSEEDES